jgi:YesN/AraC family two-component response regulator
VKGMTRIVLADDHPIVLTGLRNLIELESDFAVIGEATSGPEALKVIRDTKPNIAIAVSPVLQFAVELVEHEVT